MNSTQVTHVAPAPAQDMRPRIRLAYMGVGEHTGVSRYRLSGTVAVLYADNLWQELERMVYSSRYPNTRDAVRRSITLGSTCIPRTGTPARASVVVF